MLVWEARGRQKQVTLLHSDGEGICAAAFSATGNLRHQAVLSIAVLLKQLSSRKLQAVLKMLGYAHER